MRASRIAQNFRCRRAIIFISEGHSLDVLDVTLRRLGLNPEARTHTHPEVIALPDDLDPENDVVLIDGDLSLPASWPDNYLNAHFLAPCPTIGLVGTEAPSRLKALMQLGAMAFASKPIHSGSIYSALYLAVNAFNRTETLHASWRDLTERRNKRIHVIRAIALLMRNRGLNEDDAYDLLRKESMRARVTIEDHCWTMMEPPREGGPNDSEINKRMQAQ